MARHRNVRKMDYSEEYGYDDVYGRSLEEEVAVSPSTEAQFIYQRDSRQGPSLMSYIETRDTGRRRQQSSPLTTSTAATTTASSGHRDHKADVPPPPGFRPIQRGAGVTITTKDEPRLKLEAVVLRPVPVKLTSRGTPRVGFISPMSSIEERITPTGSGSSSPARSPARTPSPSTDLPLYPTPSRHPPPQKSGSRSKHQQIDVVAEYRKREQSSKAQINLVVIGHVDAGKSTLMGHTLYLLGHVSKRAMHKYEQESQKEGKSSFAFAWVLDETGEERYRGITMDVAQQQFETQSKLVTLLDAPGHKDFIPNMITGAAQADVAVLVVNATVGEFEAGFEAGGQTREHAILVRSLGVRQITVAVNKMDTVEWAESRFNEIVLKLKAFLKQAGFKDSDVCYVPCSGLTGENLVRPPSVQELTDWYSGPSLLQRIDQFTPPSRPVEKPFRCCISDIFKGQGSGISVAGRIESGHTQVADSVLVLPANEIATVRALSVSESSASWAVAGDHIVATVAGVDGSKISAGSVLCSPDYPVRVTTRLEARIIVFNIDVPITIGFPVLLHYHSVSEPAVLKKLISLLHKSSGELIKKKPRCLNKNSTALVEIEISRPVCMELYQDCKDLGRFMLRYGGNTIAAGVVTKIL